MFGIELPSIDDIVSTTTQVLSGGFLSFQGGQLKSGYTVNGIREGIGELTGANAARKALMDQSQAVKDYQLEQEKLFQNEQQRKWNQELMASRAAQSAQQSSLGLGVGSKSFDPASLYLGGV